MWLTTFAYSILSALVPVVNAEVYLLAASALAGPGMAGGLVLAGTVGQMVGKVGLYYVGRGALRLPGGRLRAAAAGARARAEGRTGTGGLLLFSSAVLGLPPFYLTTLASGVLRVPLARFVVIGTAGRALRFGVVVLLPRWVLGAGG